ncbi:MAG: DNA polymerase I [Wolinella sp.]
MKTLSIIDTFGFLFRSYFALPPLKSADGFPTGLLMGFANFITQLNKEYRSDYIVFALDSKEENVRKEIDANYKAHREAVPDDLLRQLPIALEWIEKMGFKSISIAGYEADDVIASVNSFANRHAINVKIFSHDKDLYQLINGDTFLFDPIKKIEIREAECIAKYGVTPAQFIDYQSIVGDSADNVPGIKGIGAKGAQKLISEFGSLDLIFESIERIESLRVRELLRSGRDDAYRSRELVRLRDDLLDEFLLDSCKFPSLNPLLKISDELIDLGLKRVLDKVKKDSSLISSGDLRSKSAHFDTIKMAKNGNGGELISKFVRKTELITEETRLFELLDSLSSESFVAFDTETDSLNTREAKLVGFSFSLNGECGYYIPIAHSYLGVPKQLGIDIAERAIKRIFKSKVIGHNLKFDLEILHSTLGFYPDTLIYDSMILAWLLDSSSQVGLDFQARTWLGHEMIPFDKMVKKGETFAQVGIEQASEYAGEDAQATYQLYFRLAHELKVRGISHLLELAERVEFPFIYTLADMEEHGIALNIEFFKELGKSVESRLSELSGEIFLHAGSEFNINSTQQLGVVLFEHLGLPSGKKTKRGYSTDERVLSELEGTHAIIPPLLEYRELFKLKSTYIEPLTILALKDENRRVYTSFLHTGTSTGRLSSRNPNLQNIPVKTEAGRQIRQGFVASEGNLLLSLDYSQIELRLLAHFSQDLALCEAFKSGADIHLETARRIFGSEHAQKNRSIAKSINFGLIYGMGARKLADTLGIAQKDAKSYIESYFASFPTVKLFLHAQEEFALQNGYTETLLGRRRYFNFEGVAEYQKAAFLREAVNGIFQGSAADLIKLSMNELRARFCEESELSLLLQVHDELIFEVKKERAEELGACIKEIMEGIYTLNVPLLCGVSIGEHWGALK